LQTNYGFGMKTSMMNEINVLRSRTFAKKVADRMAEEQYDDKGRLYPLMYANYPEDSTLVDENVVYERLKGQISVEPDRNSNMVLISFRSPSPKEAARVVDVAIQTYSDVSVDMSRQQARNALEFLSNEMKSVTQKLNVAETDLQSFMNQNNVVTLDQQATSVIQQSATVQAEKRATEMKLAALRSSLATYRKEFSTLAPGASQKLTTSASQRLQQYQTALAKVETDKVLLLSKNPNLSENDNTLRDLNNQIATLKKEIGSIATDVIGNDATNNSFFGLTDNNIMTRLSGLRETIMTLEIEEAQLLTQLQMFNAQLYRYESEFNQIPDNMMEFARKQRELQMNEKLYNLISDQAAETALWEQTQQGLGRVIDLAEVPRAPVLPNRIVVLSGFTFSGLAISVLLIVVMTLSNTKINTIEALEAKGLTLLSIVPDIESMAVRTRKLRASENLEGYLKVQGRIISQELVMLIDSISPVSESFRRLQSNIMYARPDEPMKTIVVTSANQGEGKTTVSANLAIAMAEAGKSVLVMDVDFRRPRLHQVFGEPREPGLIDALFHTHSLDSVIQDTVVPQVKVLSTGKRAPNPVEVSRSERLAQVIQELESRFDHIIIDTPPFGIISDSSSIMVKADGVIVCCRFNKTKSPEFDILLKNLTQIKAKVLGSVLTAFNPKKTTGSYYTSYYYKYNYQGYGKYQQA
jgi:capsular exopolysaccharide synthesis family protein